MRALLSFLFALTFATAVAIPAVTARATPSRRTSVVILPVDQKLVGVSWRCAPAGVCRPWFLMRLMRNSEPTASRVFTDGIHEIVAIETRDPGAWPYDIVKQVELPPGQRLLGMSWRCDGTACSPSLLMAPLGRASPRAYTFTDGATAVIYRERKLK